jgi:SAM-dependent methyltransferase
MERYSHAAENNKAPILAALRVAFPKAARVLEVGSGSGQHALHFTALWPELRWQPTEHPAVLPALEENLRAAGRPAISPPQGLDLAGRPWPEGPWDGVYAANVMHIVSVPLGEALLRGAATVLRPGGLLVLYGPYRFQGAFTTPSNAEFDQWLKARDPESGVRDFEALCAVAASVDLEALPPQPMPANNHLLLFRRGHAPAVR